jgi:uncharacterized protein
MNRNALPSVIALALSVMASSLFGQPAQTNQPALDLIRAKANQGDAQAQLELAHEYQSGSLGAPRDLKEAIRWYRKAAEQNYRLAQYNLAAAYLRGLGVEKDDLEAYKWMLLAAAQGDPSAKHDLPILEGLLTWIQRAEAQKQAAEFKPLPSPAPGAPFTVTQDTSRSDLEIKAAAGDPKAQNDLGEAFYAGKKGQRKDPVQAVKWFRLAAAHHYAPAERNLGICYELGDGVPKHDIEAYKWYLLAASQADAKAKFRLAVVDPLLFPDQRAEGKKRARDWLLNQH